MTETPTSESTSRPLPLDVVEAVVGAVPKLIERTRQQAALARSLAAMAPCLGFLAPSPSDEPAGRPTPERVDVLSVLDADVPDLTVVEDPPAADDPVAEIAEVTPLRAAPAESELPVQDYDSLAASQVVPRLATLETDELLAVQAYELAHRNRQTILNRVAQLLAG